MIRIRRSDDRGRADFGWLDARHTFSFGEYYDPEHMGFRALRVINEDRVAGGGGFPTHGHRDMEIVTYVLSGGLRHRDSMGNGSVLRAGDVQRMSAGTGVRHSEMNDSPAEPVHLLQIWIEPQRAGIDPGWEEKHFGDDVKRNRLAPIAAGGPAARAGGGAANGALKIHQDADVYASVLDAGARVRHELAPGRHAWVQAIRGEVALGGEVLAAGDGAAVTGEAALELVAGDGEAELLLFDLA